ncbi:hypothetical protein IWQ61_008371 [Dispira simplex]|nr:hypothetical protein IWQ61_008371 [Dispira simplex]
MPATITASAITLAAWSEQFTAQKWLKLLQDHYDTLPTAEARAQQTQVVVDTLIERMDAGPLLSPQVADYVNAAVAGLPFESGRRGAESTGPSQTSRQLSYMVPLTVFLDQVTLWYTRYPGTSAEHLSHYVQNMVALLLRWCQLGKPMCFLQDDSPHQETDSPDYSNELADPLVVEKWLLLVDAMVKCVLQQIPKWLQEVTMGTDSDIMMVVDNPETNDALDTMASPVKSEPLSDRVGQLTVSTEVTIANATDLHSQLLERIRFVCLFLSQWLQTQWTPFEHQVTRQGPQNPTLAKAWTFLEDRMDKLRNLLQNNQDQFLGDDCVYRLLMTLREHGHVNRSDRTTEGMAAIWARLRYVPRTRLDLGCNQAMPNVSISFLLAQVASCVNFVPDSALATRLATIQTMQGLSDQELYLGCWLAVLRGLAEVNTQELSLAKLHRIQVWRALLFTKLPNTFHHLIYSASLDAEPTINTLVYRDNVTNRLMAMERVIFQLAFYKQLVHSCRTPDGISSSDVVTMISRICTRKEIVRPEFVLEASAKFPADESLEASLLVHADTDLLVGNLVNNPTSEACREFVMAAFVDFANQQNYVEAVVQILIFWAKNHQFTALTVLCELLQDNLPLVYVIQLLHPIRSVIETLKEVCENFYFGIHSDSHIMEVSPVAMDTDTPQANPDADPFSRYLDFQHILILLLRIIDQPYLLSLPISSGQATPFIDQWLHQYRIGEFENSQLATVNIPADPTNSECLIVSQDTVDRWYSSVFTTDQPPTALPLILFRECSPLQWLQLAPQLVTQASYAVVTQRLSESHLITFLKLVADSPASFGLVGVIRSLSCLATRFGHKHSVFGTALREMLDYEGLSQSLLVTTGPGVLTILKHDTELRVNLWTVQAKLLPYANANSYLAPALDTDQLVTQLNDTLACISHAGNKRITDPVAKSRALNHASPSATGVMDINLFAHVISLFGQRVFILQLLEALRTSSVAQVLVRVSELVACLVTVPLGPSGTHNDVDKPGLFEELFNAVLPAWMQEHSPLTYHQEVAVGFLVWYTGVLELTNEHITQADVKGYQVTCAVKTSHQLDPSSAGQAALGNFLRWYLVRVTHLTPTDSPVSSGSTFGTKTRGVNHLPSTGVLDVLLLHTPTCYWVSQIYDDMADG